MTAGLFATCLVNIARPQIGLAAAKALDMAGAEWSLPRAQTCCGQVAYNSGFRARAAASAAHCAEVFAACDKVVVPSGSCCGFLKKHAPELSDIAGEGVVELGGKCAELSEFLLERDFKPPRRKQPLTVTYHDSCAGLRELGIKKAPRELLKRAGVTIKEMNECETCCGFGGAFAEKFGEISSALADAKVDNITKAATPLPDSPPQAGEGAVSAVVMGDSGCMMHIEGRLSRLRRNVKVMHWLEALFDSPH